MKKGIVIGLLTLIMLNVVYSQNMSPRNQSDVPIDVTPVMKTTNGTGIFETISGLTATLANRARGAFNWVFTRDYVSAAQNLVIWALQLPNAVKAVFIVALVFILIFIWAYYFRDTRANNMRKARRLHKKGKKEHKSGNEEMAEFYYRRAREIREKAQEQW